MHQKLQGRAAAHPAARPVHTRRICPGVKRPPMPRLLRRDEPRAPPRAVRCCAEAPQFQVHMQVRAHEIDQYQVVNNAVYLMYLQHVRHEYLEHIGLDGDAVARSGCALALSELPIRFLAPLRSRDAFVGTLCVTGAGGARVHIEQQLLRRVQLVATAEVVVVSLDEAYRPRRLPAQVRQLLLSGRPRGDGEGPVSWS